MNTRKFTFIELITVILIVGIVSVSATALFDKSTVSESELKSAINLFRADIRFIQTKALLNDDPTKVYSFKTSANGYQMLINGLPPTNEFLPQRQDGQRTFDNITFSPSNLELTFDNLGKPFAGPNNISISFLLSTPDHNTAITLMANGRLF